MSESGDLRLNAMPRSLRGDGCFQENEGGPSDTGLKVRGRGWKKFLRVLPFDGKF